MITAIIARERERETMRIDEESEGVSASRNHLVFAYYVTGHGFGHATRVVEVSYLCSLLSDHCFLQISMSIVQLLICSVNAVFFFSSLSVGCAAPDSGRPRCARRNRSAGLRFHVGDRVASALHSQGITFTISQVACLSMIIINMHQ